jgi:hypothetical protein
LPYMYGHYSGDSLTPPFLASVPDNGSVRGK